jgi:hypothetical protein
MSNSIEISYQFHGKYNAIINGEAIPCNNLSTARAIVRRANTSEIVRCSNTLPKIECVGFCSPSGQYYAVVRVDRSPYLDHDVRIDCHNETTLRAWIRDGISIGDFRRASENQNNVRSQGGWNG